LLASAAFTSRDFRHALGQFATGVTIVTTADAQGHPVGLTISSFNSVSLEPPLVLWSLGHRAASLPIFQQCTHYAIHVLAAEQQVLAQRFATRGVDKFAGLDWQPNAQGVPLITGAAAVFECTHRNRHDEGDHTIFVGQVQHCQHLQGARPLLYHGGHMYAQHGVPAAPYTD
jgi:flavin reductase (DIM6/NTAB) family NADH-FMN oxidoreductase RutF